MAISHQDKRDMDKFIKFLCLKSAQVIVQGRLGKSIVTQSVATPSGAEWFNLAIKDYPEILKEVKAAMANGNPSTGRSLVIEISLRTSDADSLVLEVWSIGVTNKCDDVRIHHTVYNRMSMLLRSLLCVSRMTPAYKLSRKQGKEYVICYRVYMGQISLNGLGEGFKTLRVGSVASPVGTVTMSAAYRTTENLHVSTKGVSTQLMGLADDHTSSAAQPCYTLTSRLRTLSETSDSNPLGRKGSYSPSFNMFNASQSASPLPDKTDGDRGFNAKAMFTVGTPPRGANTTTPHNRFQHRSNSTGFQRIPQVQTSSKGSSPVKSTHSHIRYGFSAPTLNINTTSGNPTQKAAESNLTDVDSRSNNTQPDGENNTATTFCHWNNSNVTKVQADSVLLPNSPAHNVPVTKPKKNGKVVLGWKDDSTSTKQSTKYASSPPFLVSGAFVSGSKTANRAQATLAAAEALVQPFTDLVNVDNASDDNLSQKSDSDNGLELNRLGDRKSQTRSDSSDSLTSKHSEESSGGTPEHFGKQRLDDFVMVDLNPAFGRDDSVGDLGNFYRECENIPELIMFEEHKGTETDETLLDLAQELEVCAQDMAEFDEFISEIHT
uniref:Autophagy-related protein 13 n=1 Tax=Phallusia mammillata TaxID=59560 RepID=A0A6F9D6V5_9ASCI|nr:autophagy-related protein 13-like [Phallusia mammillata]